MWSSSGSSIETEIDMNYEKPRKHLYAALFLLSLGLPLGAQTPEARSEAEQRLAQQQNWATKIYQLKNADANRVHGLLSGVFRAEIRRDDAMKTLVVRAPQE